MGAVGVEGVHVGEEVGVEGVLDVKVEEGDGGVGVVVFGVELVGVGGVVDVGVEMHVSILSGVMSCRTIIFLQLCVPSS